MVMEKPVLGNSLADIFSVLKWASEKGVVVRCVRPCMWDLTRRDRRRHQGGRFGLHGGRRDRMQSVVGRDSNVFVMASLKSAFGIDMAFSAYSIAQPYDPAA